MTRRAAAVIGALSVLACGVASADTIQADSQIVAVTVFPDRADVTRRAALSLTPGPHLVEVGPLPATVEPGSITARGSGEGAVSLYGAHIVTRELEAAQDPAVKALEKQVRELTARERALVDLKGILAEERAYLESIRAASSEQIGKDLITRSPSAADAAAILAFLDEAFLKNAERDALADREREELAQELDRVRRELAPLTRNRYRRETIIEVELDASASGAFELETSYRVPGASWEPAYEARAGRQDGVVDLLLYGVVRQQTGEEWVDASLTLSTAKPAVAGSMPELEPWYLRPWEEIVPRPAAMSPAAILSRSVFQVEEETAAPEDRSESQEARLALAAVQAQGPAVTFVLPKPATVRSDWQPHKVPVLSSRLRAGFAYEATPRLLPYAFLRAKVVNTSDGFLLAGPVAVFLDGAFIATSGLSQVAPNEEFDLYLGVDERVKVEHRQVKAKEDISLLPGLRGKMKSTDYEFLTTLENYTGRRVTVAVFDQIPVSEREEIVVESVRPSPAGIEKDPEKPGVFHWALELAPNQREELRLAYRIRHPAGLRIQ